MLAIILCFVGLAYGQYPPAAPYPPAVEGPYPPAYQAVRSQPQSAPIVQQVQPAEIQPVHHVQPVYPSQRVIQPVYHAQPAIPIQQQPVAVLPVQPIRTLHPAPVHHVQPVGAQPVLPIQQFQPVRSNAPYPPAPVQLEGGELSPVEQDATPTGTNDPSSSYVMDLCSPEDVRMGEISRPIKKRMEIESPSSSPTHPSNHNSGKYPSPGEKQQLSGGDLSPEQLEIPPNTQVKLQDDRLQYSHGFSDDKGTSVREQGSLLSTNEGWEYVIAKKGSYSYVSPEGKTISVNYIADHNGFRVLPN